MKILFLTPRDSRKHIGGVETHVRLLTQELEKRGNKVEELTLDDVMNTCKGPTLPWQGRTLRYKLSAWGHLWQHRDLIQKVDIVHIHDVFWWYLPFRFLFPTKTVYTTFHGWEGECPPSRSAILQKRIAKMLSRGTIGIGAFFQKWYGVEPDKVSFGALDPKFVRLPRGRTGRYVPRNDKPKSIAFYGRMNPVNDIDVALEAFEILKGSALSSQGRALKDVEFFFIGDGPVRKDAENIGRVTGMTETPWKFLLQSDLVITSSYLCLLETAALMRPIISIATNPLKNDYLASHPLSRYMTICHSPKELTDAILPHEKNKKQKTKSTEDIQRAYRWTTSQTPSKLADLYVSLWNR